MIRRFVSSALGLPVGNSISSSIFIWIDLELTGLNVDEHEIMEVACIPTTPDLEPLDKGMQIQLQVSPESLAKMDDWCTKTHRESGLTEACLKSKIPLQDAEKLVVDYISRFSSPNDTRYMAGNTIYMDRRFIDKYMPKLSSLHHYRLLDVSSVKILSKHWYPDLILPQKKYRHRGLDDVLESINELKEYRKTIFK